MLRHLGQGKRIDELVTTINRSAKAAIAIGRDLLVGAVRTMNVTYLKNILKGGEASVTNLFAAKTRTPLSDKFLPVVTKATKTVGLANRYNKFAGKAAGFGLVKT